MDVRDVRHRMSVPLPRSGLETWFDAEAELEELEDLPGLAPMGVLGLGRLENGRVRGETEDRRQFCRLYAQYQSAIRQ